MVVFKSLLNGKSYKMLRKTDYMAVLDSIDGTSQILTELGNLKIFYRKEDHEQNAAPSKDG